jgi:acyl CoA:acetate/3-ketoacid CoA transferase
MLSVTYSAPYVRVSLYRYAASDEVGYLTAEEAEAAYAEFTAAINIQRQQLGTARADAVVAHQVENNPSFGSHPGTGN